ncbi:MAG TPA: hypothetical protein QGF05_04920 [Dehalococcoidia bacterium]|nr:hypothetical protein [Dehalococcoidia bacterium]
MTEPTPPQDRIELHIRGLPEWLIRKYLAEMGATGDAEDLAEMHTDTWAVSWTTQRVPIAGSSGIGLTQFDITFSGDPAILPDVETQFMKKAQRGGG